MGTIALIGTATIGIGLGRPFLITPIFDWQTNSMIILVVIIAAPLTFYLNCHKGNGPVMASAVVGLTGGLILPPLFPQIGSTLALVAFNASFAGMANQKRCPRFWHTFIVGLFTGIIFVFSMPLLGGTGGKLSTIAFGAVLSTYGYTRLYRKFYGINSRFQTDQGT